MYEQKYNWDAIAAFIAALIGLLAIFISAYTAWNVRQQTRAQVWPYLNVAESDSLPTDTVKESHGGTLLATNRGVGPAIVRRVEILVDGKPQPDWNHAFKTLGLHPQSVSTSTLDHTVLSPGDTTYFLTIIGHKDWERFRSKLFGDIVIRACYCSTLGECWTSTLNFQKRARQGQPIGSCSQIPKSDDFND